MRITPALAAALDIKSSAADRLKEKSMAKVVALHGFCVSPSKDAAPGEVLQVEEWQARVMCANGQARPMTQAELDASDEDASKAAEQAAKDEAEAKRLADKADAEAKAASERADLELKLAAAETAEDEAKSALDAAEGAEAKAAAKEVLKAAAEQVKQAKAALKK